jgi:hypothetical protein
MTIDITAVTDLVLGTLNAQVMTSSTMTGYNIYGMAVTDSSVDTAIELARRNLLSMVGETAYNDPNNKLIYESYMVDMAAVRLCLNMLGIAIPTHFNYKTLDLSVSKNPNPSLEEMIRRLETSINQWIRFVLKDNWTGYNMQDDLYIESIINYRGINYITRDADSLGYTSRR